jgi:hypothetical protein
MYRWSGCMLDGESLEQLRAPLLQQPMIGLASAITRVESLGAILINRSGLFGFLACRYRP